MDSAYVGLGIRIKPKRTKDGKVETKKTWIYYHTHGGYRARLWLAPYKSEDELPEIQKKASGKHTSHLNGTLEAETKAAKKGLSNTTEKSPLDLKIGEICDLYLQSKVFQSGHRPSSQKEIEPKFLA